MSSVQYKVWVKPGAEQSFLYGNHVLKSGLGRITENTAQYQGVVVYSMADVPLVSESRNTLYSLTDILDIGGCVLSVMVICRGLEWQRKPHRNAAKWIPWPLWCFTRLMWESTSETRTHSPNTLLQLSLDCVCILFFTFQSFVRDDFSDSSLLEKSAKCFALDGSQ